MLAIRKYYRTLDDGEDGAGEGVQPQRVGEDIHAQSHEKRERHHIVYIHPDRHTYDEVDEYQGCGAVEEHYMVAYYHLTQQQHYKKHRHINHVSCHILLLCVECFQ
jgi:hypothetical protein